MNNCLNTSSARCWAFRPRCILPFVVDSLADVRTVLSSGISNNICSSTVSLEHLPMRLYGNVIGDDHQFRVTVVDLFGVDCSVRFGRRSAEEDVVRQGRVDDCIRGYPFPSTVYCWLDCIRCEERGRTLVSVGDAVLVFYNDILLQQQQLRTTYPSTYRGWNWTPWRPYNIHRLITLYLTWLLR